MNWEFWGEHWFLSICALCVCYEVVFGVRVVVCRVFRTINITVRGWPPAHLDGDGDWSPKE